MPQRGHLSQFVADVQGECTAAESGCEPIQQGMVGESQVVYGPGERKGLQGIDRLIFKYAQLHGMVGC